MYEAILARMERRFQDRDFLTIEDLTRFLECSPDTVYNWIKRADATRRPPKLRVGNELKFPIEPLAKWLAVELGKTK